MSRGLWFNVNYTWAKGITDTGLQGYPNGIQQNQYARFYERADDPALRRQQLRFSYVWDVPVGRGRKAWSDMPRALDFVIGGWQLAGITTLLTGARLSPSYSNADPALLFRLTQRLVEEFQKLRPDALITWGPDGGYGHPDHRIISSIVTQLVRAAAPGVPQRLFYGSIPAEGILAMNPTRGVPPFVLPQPSLFNVRVSFTPADLDAARRSMACHKTQVPEEAVERVFKSMEALLKGELPLTRMVPGVASNDLFR
jgi:hypothetical protein